MRRRTMRSAAVAVAALMIVAGCSSGSDEQVEVETSDGTATIGQSDDLPDDFPEDVPLPDDFELGKVSTASLESQGSAVTVELTSTQTPPEFAVFYETELTESGWAVTQKAVDETGGVVNATKGDRFFSLAMNGDADQTEMLLNTGDS